MRLALVLVALLVAPPASAQVPPDDPRVERLLDALDLPRRDAAALGDARQSDALGVALTSVPAPTVRDAVRARLAATATPARLDSALAAAGDGRLAAFTDRLARLSAPELQDPLFRAMLAPPKKGTLPDSSEAAAFVEASGLRGFTVRLMRDAFAAVAEAVPAAAAQLTASGRTLDDLVADQMAFAMQAQVLADRVAASGTPVPTRRRAAAFAATDAARWASAAVFDGLLDAYGPAIARATIDAARVAAGTSPVE